MNKYSVEQEKKIYYLRGGRIDKSVPRDNRLSPLGKPRDAKRRSSGRIFLSYPYTHDRYLKSLLLDFSMQKKQGFFQQAETRKKLST